MLGLALVLQGSTCRVDSSTDNDMPDDGGTRSLTILLPPLRDALGRPMSGPIPIELERGSPGRDGSIRGRPAR